MAFCPCHYPPPLSSNIHDEDDGGQPAVAMALTAALTFTHLTALNHRKLNVIAIQLPFLGAHTAQFLGAHTNCNPIRIWHSWENNHFNMVKNVI